MINRKSKRKAERAEKKSFKKEVKDAFSYIKESKNYIYAIVLIFLVSGFIGFVFSSGFSALDEMLKELAEKVSGMGPVELILFILKNNLSVAFSSILFGAILGIFPLLASFSNGIVLGYVMKGVWESYGISEFWRILPHGVFELPAIFLSLALGLRLGMFVFAKNRKKEFLDRLKKSMILFVFLVLPLLIAAAIIEGILIFVYK